MLKLTILACYSEKCNIGFKQKKKIEKNFPDLRQAEFLDLSPKYNP